MALALSLGANQRRSASPASATRASVLDELTTGLDPQARRETWSLIEAIRDRGVTILLVTHFMEESLSAL
jgi:ABC-2 type transport system ATP-binding protein